MKIDVVMCTKNSETILDKCLKSIFEEIPVCHLIVLDGFSTDKTLDIIESYKNKFNIKIIKTEAALGKSREIGIKNVDTEWFVFIDSDVILRQGWFRGIISYISDCEVGAIESNFIHHNPTTIPKFTTFEKVVDQRRVDTRGYTIATLIKTRSVEGILIPFDLMIYEDEFIKKWVEKKGYKWKKVVGPVVDHYPDPDPFRDAYLTGIYSIRYNLFPTRNIIVSSLASPFKLFYFLYKYRSVESTFNSLKYNLIMLKGLLDELFAFS
ncbi:glycosyltransferase family 2 protein [Methanobacterium sp.]|jgi:glycosyltransferase involved in cell wall biosynthesis|uniref:glycosyltransferase family 2 protein n=1 Tax=Methanobacterium sp. TaxID=2164 RepID=UPI0031589C8E